MNTTTPRTAHHIQLPRNSFLLDTGADISLIKIYKLKGDTLIYEDTKFLLRGIDNNSSPSSVQTLGYLHLDILIGKTQVTHLFHVIRDDFLIQFDGIVGNDLLKQHTCHVDYENDILHINTTRLPLCCIENPLANNNPNTHESHVNQSNQETMLYSFPIIVQPRSESKILIKIINPEISVRIVRHTTILDGIYLCPSIGQIQSNSIALTSVLNNTERPAKISAFSIKLEPLVQMSNIKKILLEQSLRLTHLNKAEFNHIFYLEGDELTCTDAIQHNIPTTSNAPIHTKTYRYPEAHKAEVNQQITKMLNQNIIRPSNSPWNSPVWVVPKKQDASGKQKWRLVIDYRKLNEISIGDSYPLPKISEILDQLGHSKYFTIRISPD